jgi:hypothetical protein
VKSVFSALALKAVLKNLGATLEVDGVLVCKHHEKEVR